MAIVTVGIDLAKNVFAVHGVDESGNAVLIRPSVKRAALLELVAELPPCLIGMEACSGAHHWAREFARFGHTARLIAPKFVTPCRLSGKKGKNDAADAQAICEAVSRPNMRFVSIKTLDQQGQLLIHRARQGFVEQRTATLNRIRDLLSQFGIVLPLKAAVVRREALQHLEDLPGWINTVVGDLLSEVSRLDERITQYDQHIALGGGRYTTRLDSLCGQSTYQNFRLLQARYTTAPPKLGRHWQSTYFEVFRAEEQSALQS